MKLKFFYDLPCCLPAKDRFPPYTPGASPLAQSSGPALETHHLIQDLSWRINYIKVFKNFKSTLATNIFRYSVNAFNIFKYDKTM